MRDGCLDDSSNGYVWVSCWVSEYITSVTVVSKLVYLFRLVTRCKNHLPYLGVLWSYKSILHQVPAIDIPGFPKDTSHNNDEAKPPTKVQ